MSKIILVVLICRVARALIGVELRVPRPSLLEGRAFDFLRVKESIDPQGISWQGGAMNELRSENPS
jgi:hypothetical protein